MAQYISPFSFGQTSCELFQEFKFYFGPNRSFRMKSKLTQEFRDEKWTFFFFAPLPLLLLLLLLLCCYYCSQITVDFTSLVLLVLLQVWLN